MKRSWISIFAVSLMLCAVSGAGAATVIGTRHDLSSSGTRSIQSSPTGSGGTTEVCVFCHTPHSSRPAAAAAPLWNRAEPTTPYTVYASDVMNALNITAESPVSPAEPGYEIHAKTRICMSCHDGTIALGSLANLPPGASGNIAMTGVDASGKMPSTAMGYIGTDLRDDHPVAVKHMDATHPDLELHTISGANVRLYPATANGNYIECTSCHDAHDNTYGNFLIDDNVGSKLCLSCHTKQGYSSLTANESVHSNTTYSTSYSPPTGGVPPYQNLGTTMETVKCMVCHYPHNSGITIGSNNPNPGSGKYLLTYKEEQSCYNNPNRWGQTTSVCHGSLATTTKNIYAEVNKSSAHHVDTSTGLHRATEGRSGVLGWTTGEAGSGWHVECDDCHNTHSAGKLLHTNGTNTVNPKLSINGAGGVAVSWPLGGWNATWLASNYTYIQPLGVVETSGGVTYEYEICLKCHSSWGGSIPASMSDQAKEFNITNPSYHPVVQNNPATYNSAAWNPSPPTGWSGFSSSSLMYCSDCHGNSSTVQTDPKGPHGSGISGLLRTAFSTAYTTPGTNQPTSDLCFNCHDVTAYQSGISTQSGTGFMTNPGGVNLHTQHRILSTTSSTSQFGYMCVNCHAKIPHGYQNYGLIVTASDTNVPSPTFYAASPGAKIQSFSYPGPSNYGAAKNSNCTTVGTGCHQ